MSSKVKRYKNIEDFGRDLGVTPERINIAKIKTKLKKRIIQEIYNQDLSAADVAEISGLSRTTVSGVIHGSLVSVSLERLIRLASAVDLSVELNIKKAA